MTDLSHLNKYYKELIKDIYPQPMDEGHLEMMEDAIRNIFIINQISTVLDVGCGQGDAQSIFEEFSIQYLGLTLGSDHETAKELSRNVVEMDFNFLDFPDNSFDLVFSRHSLEHSPFPLLTLMEWHRVSKKWLFLVLPNPETFSYMGRNHYSVLNKQHAMWLIRRAGWKVTKDDSMKEEYRFLCKKLPRVSYEGWATAPVEHDIYVRDRSAE